MGLKIKDLFGKMVKVEILDFSQSQKDGKSITVLRCENDGAQLDIGLFGEDVADKVLEAHGSSEKGKNYLEVPESKLTTDGGMIWMNQAY